MTYLGNYNFQVIHYGIAQDFFSFNNVYLILFTFIIGIVYYYLFCIPFDSREDLTEYGFEQTKTFRHSNSAKKIIVNQMQKRRKVGDIPPVFPNGWFVVLESAKLRKLEVQELFVLGLNLVIWRGASGRAYIADAYCPHLGAHLGVGGEARQECITCPFHGWEFDGSDGHLANIANCNTDLNKLEAAKLNMRTAVEHCGFIYMFYHAEGEEPLWWPDFVPEIEGRVWPYRGRSEFYVSAILQDIQENGADRTHFNHLHEPSIFAGATPWYYFWSRAITKYVFVTEWKALKKDEGRHKAAFEMTARVRLFDQLTIFKMSVRVVQVGPATARMELKTIIGDGVLMISITPVEPLLQRIVHRLYTGGLFIRPLARWFLHMYDVMLCRDIVMWNRKTYLPNPVLTKEDTTIRAYRKWYSQFYSKNSPTYSPTLNVKDKLTF